MYHSNKAKRVRSNRFSREKENLKVLLGSCRTYVVVGLSSQPVAASERTHDEWTIIITLHAIMHDHYLACLLASLNKKRCLVVVKPLLLNNVKNCLGAFGCRTYINELKLRLRRKRNTVAISYRYNERRKHNNQ